VNWAADQPVTSLRIQRVRPFAVLCQVAGPREGLAAGGAGVGANARMGAHVSHQVAGLREGLAAGLACVGAGAGMGAHVGSQGAGHREGLAASGAGVRADAGMAAHVHRQVAGLREGLAAGGAGVGADAGMGAHVYRQVAGRRAGLAAGLAGVGADAGMAARVSRQFAGRREGLAADGACQVQLDLRPTPPPLAQPGSATTPSIRRGRFPPPLAFDRCQIRRRVLHLRVPQALTNASTLRTFFKKAEILGSCRSRKPADWFTSTN